MELKTKIHTEEGKQDLLITRHFDLPPALLFRAFVEPDIVAQWMGTSVLRLEARKFGAYQFETTDPKGHKHRFSGVIHEFVPEVKITRTFEMENTPFPVQLEFLEFEKLSDNSSRFSMQIVYKSLEHKNQMLQLPFAQGINMAHNRLQEIVQSLK
ncbi:MAG TPA: SRPBCC domain-containing protein [Saprospiraceae bacterium]|nr:SRPBCC domain-containing protein [Saprospiraceae bacterium]